MGTQPYEYEQFEAFGSRSLDVPRLGRRSIACLTVAGRFGAVWLPAYIVLSAELSSLGALTVATWFACVWFLCLNRSLSVGRLPLLCLGPALAAAVGTVVGLAAVAALATVARLSIPLPALVVTAAGVFALSWAWEAFAQPNLADRRRVLVLGMDGGGTRLAADVEADAPAFEVIAVVGDEHVDEIGQLVERERPDIVVLASGDLRAEALDQLLDGAAAGFKLIRLAEFYEHAFGRVPVETLRRPWFVNVLNLYRRPYPRLAKRCFDVVVAATGLLLTSWLLPLLWLAVRRTPGPVLYRQTRLGEGGRPFTMLKFRTMLADAEPAGAVWTRERDPRVTRVGRVLRRTHLDELPQLLNVLKGEMSIVGPRPERPEFLGELQEAVPFWTRRHLVKPGITGWAQLLRGYTADADGTAEKLSYDLWYLRHRSLAIDLAVCVKTVTTLLTGAGAR